jgi:hypothetical protein
MAKCFITGVELKMSEAHVLDNYAARVVLRDMRQRVSALERLIQQLSPSDDEEVYDAKKQKQKTIKNRRLVSAEVAKALCAASPEKNLFLLWTEWYARKRSLLAKYLNTAKTHKKAETGTLPNRAVVKPNDAVDDKKGERHATCA